MALFKIFRKSHKKTVSRKVRKVKPKPKPKPIKHKIVKKVKVKKFKKIEARKEVKLEFKKMPDEKAYELLKRYRIPLPEYAFCKKEGDLKVAFKKIGFPCVMKVSGNIIHKTNVNGVRLNINSEEEAVKAFRELIKIKGCVKVLVQKMITEGYEIIVGGKKDPQFNRVVALGAGGIFTEFLKDVSFRVSPLSREDAEQMLREVKFSDLILKGFRGQKPADANSIIEVILSVSKIMENNPQIKELDINPLAATPTKAIAEDVRIILE
jgi:succinyl-CoA synthetase beta subunit